MAKGYLEGATLLGLEDSGSRMARLGLGPDRRERDHPRRRAPGPHPGGDRRRRGPRAAPRPGRTGVLSVVGPFADDEPVLASAVDRAAAPTPGTDAAVACRALGVPADREAPVVPADREAEAGRAGVTGKSGAMVRVGVFGAGGRMGTAVCQAVADDPELELVAAVDPFHAGLDLRQVTGVDAHLQIAAGPEALLDGRRRGGRRLHASSTPPADNLAWLAANGVHAVVGTTGFTADDLERFGAAFTRATASSPPTSPSARC